jgi:hypothetical protein
MFTLAITLSLLRRYVASGVTFEIPTSVIKKAASRSQCSLSGMIQVQEKVQFTLEHATKVQ